MTVQQQRLAANHWPGLDVLPTGTRARVSARIARIVSLLGVDLAVPDDRLALHLACRTSITM